MAERNLRKRDLVGKPSTWIHAYFFCMLRLFPFAVAQSESEIENVDLEAESANVKRNEDVEKNRLEQVLLDDGMFF